MPALAVLLFSFTLVACETESPLRGLIQTRIIYPDMPPTKCARRPTVPDPRSCNDICMVEYLAQRDLADEDCRAKLDDVDAAISKWPKPEPAKPES